MLIVAGSVMATGFCVTGPPRMKLACWAAAAAIVICGILVPARDDGVLLARGSKHLVLAGAAGEAIGYAAETRAGRRPLSGFLADSVAWQLAQPVISQSGNAALGPGRFGHELRGGGVVVVVTSRRGLSAGCRSGMDMLISLVPADYPCRSGMPLVSLAGLPQDNYRLTVTRDGVRLRAGDGQYLRINPVSLP